jgi:5-oxoprolinase (ATP-hydrolysing)/N-methylhydantoinase A
MRFTEAETFYPLKCLLTPGIRASAGCYRAFTVTAPEGSILNCTRPASVGLRHLTGWYIIGNVFQAMAEAMPDRVRAFTGLPTIVAFYGKDQETGRVYGDHIFLGGGQGAGMRGGIGVDGKSSMLFPTSAANGSIEVFESRVPVIIEEKAFVPDSGGAGAGRGGLGQYIRFRRWKRDGGETLVNINPEGVGVATHGLFGGLPGGMVRAARLGGNGTPVEEYSEGTLQTLAAPEDVLEVRVGGGAGFGDPLDRSLPALRKDLADGYVSQEAAMRHYGCIIDAAGNLDEAATARHRAQLRGMTASAAN